MNRRLWDLALAVYLGSSGDDDEPVSMMSVHAISVAVASILLKEAGRGVASTHIHPSIHPFIRSCLFDHRVPGAHLTFASRGVYAEANTRFLSFLRVDERDETLTPFGPLVHALVHALVDWSIRVTHQTSSRGSILNECDVICDV